MFYMIIQIKRIIQVDMEEAIMKQKLYMWQRRIELDWGETG